MSGYQLVKNLPSKAAGITANLQVLRVNVVLQMTQDGRFPPFCLHVSRKAGLKSSLSLAIWEYPIASP
jgi:hypothetical protein